MNLKRTVFILLLAAASQCLWATALGDLASQMKAGEWRELSTVNLLPTIQGSAGGASGTIFPYAQNGVWDPGSESFYFVGSDHQHTTGYAKFVQYKAANNTWREMTRPSWFGALTASAMHGYDHNAIDAKKGILYFMNFCCPAALWKYSIKDSVWTKAPDPNLAYAYQTEGGLEHFPEIGGLVFAEGGAVYFLADGANQWSVPLATGLTMGDYHNFAEYNPVHHVVVFGGGNGSSALYKLDTLKHVTKLGDAPSEVSDLRVNSNMFTVDPVSGDYLVFGGANGSGVFYSYNVLNDTWTKQNQAAPFLTPQTDANAGAVYRTVAAPVSTYGVNIFAKYEGGGKVYVYKHSSGNRVENRAGVSGQRMKLAIQPNPFRSGSILRFEGNFPSTAVKFSVYNSEGRLVNSERTTSAALREGVNWAGKERTSGIYIFRMDFGTVTVSARAILMK